MQATFFHSPGSLLYSFGKGHPYNSERLRRTVLALEHFKLKGISGAVPASDKHLLLVHPQEYVDMLKFMSENPKSQKGLKYGIGTGDTPAFEGMYEAACNVVGGTVAGAESICCGDTIVFHLAGGLHHSQRGLASGFCFINDIAIGIEILRKRFNKVAYVDIDLHHGDGVERIFWDNPHVLTASIHQFGHGFYPGTGDSAETDSFGTAVNVALRGGSGGSTWLRGFEEGIMKSLEIYKPDVIVLQMGVDAHYKDPLGTLRILTQDWYKAVEQIRDFGVPILALGGGGYFPPNPPRMWTAAVHLLLNEPIPQSMPQHLLQEWKNKEYDYTQFDFIDNCKLSESADVDNHPYLADTPGAFLDKNLSILKTECFPLLDKF